MGKLLFFMDVEILEIQKLEELASAALLLEIRSLIKRYVRVRL